MIINIRGTSGSGKSTIVRQIKELYGNINPVFVEKRKQPIGYICKDASNKYQNLFIVGHYETACGGCDSINSYDQVFEIVRQYRDMGYFVIFEGVLLVSETKRTIKLFEDGYDLRVLFLDTILEKCLESIAIRRSETYLRKLDQFNKGLIKTKPKEPLPVNPLRTKEKHSYSIRQYQKLSNLGLNCYAHNRKDCYNEIKKLISK